MSSPSLAVLHLSTYLPRNKPPRERKKKNVALAKGPIAKHPGGGGSGTGGPTEPLPLGSRPLPALEHRVGDTLVASDGPEPLGGLIGRQAVGDGGDGLPLLLGRVRLARRLGCTHVSSLTPVSFPFSVFLYSTLSLVSSLVSRGNSAEIINSWALRLVWAQNQPTLGKIPGILRVYLETPQVYLENTCILPFRFRLRFCPRPALGLDSRTQGNSRVARMEHQTPSGFPGNFRKRKVLGTLSFPFWFPETWVQANAQAVPHSPRA